MTMPKVLVGGALLVLLSVLSGCLSNPDVSVSGKTTVQTGMRGG
jgi:hypothetical protein